MRELSAKTRLIAAITAIAVALVCVFAAVFYTRAGLETPAGDPEQGEVAAAQPLDYGDATGGIPSDAVAIGDQTAFYRLYQRHCKLRLSDRRYHAFDVGQRGSRFGKRQDS